MLYFICHFAFVPAIATQPQKIFCKQTYAYALPHTHTHNIIYIEFLYLCSSTRARPTTHSLILSRYVADRKKRKIREAMQALKQRIGVGGQTGVYCCAYLDISQGTKTAREMNWPAASQEVRQNRKQSFCIQYLVKDIKFFYSESCMPSYTSI